MPTSVGILIFISIINTTSERLTAINFFNCWYFSFYEQLKVHAQLSSIEISCSVELNTKNGFITSGPELGPIYYSDYAPDFFFRKKSIKSYADFIHKNKMLETFVGHFF